MTAMRPGRTNNTPLIQRNQQGSHSFTMIHHGTVQIIYIMNPYEADPEKIPDTDRYQDVPLYGRYLPRSDDFKPNPSHINSTSPESIQYWESVLCLCNPGNRIYENQDGGRDVFALGSVIVKSSHLKKILDGRRAHRDYSLADANEAEATALVREHVRSMKVPKIYFSNEVRHPTASWPDHLGLKLLLDQWSKCSGSVSHTWRRSECGLAVYLCCSKTIVQETSSRLPAPDIHTAFPISSALLCCSG